MIEPLLPLLRVLSTMSPSELVMLTIVLLSLAAPACFSGALYLWAAQGGHLRLAERLERSPHSPAGEPTLAPSSSAPASDED